MRNFSPVQTVYLARCTSCGRVWDGHGDIAGYTDDDAMVNEAAAGGWVAKWEVVDTARGLELVELLCGDCQPAVSNTPSLLAEHPGLSSRFLSDKEVRTSESETSTGAVPGTVTRVVVITESGVAGEFWGDSWEVRIQDGGQTAKLFSHGTGDAAGNQRSAGLAQDLGRYRW